MWTAQIEQGQRGRVLKYAVLHDSSPIAYAEVIDCWQSDASFRSWFLGLLSDSPFLAFRWETPSVTLDTVARPFEFVLLDSPSLDRPPDAEAFAKRFSSAPKESVVAFPNLGNDAVLVVPCPRGPHTAYGHLGAFVRHAAELQRHDLWQLVGETMQRRLSPTPIWLSTAGAGVSWLHIRLDDRPKYYSYSPYRDNG